MSWETGLTSLWEKVWAELELGVKDATHPARFPAFGTLCADGPAIRTVVLRSTDRVEACFEVHTDALSSKVAELSRDDRVALHVWVERHALQIRLWARASLSVGDPTKWAQIPASSQIVYGGTPPPGTPIATPEDHTPGATQARFAILRCAVTKADIVHLGDDLHRRAVFEEPDWSGRWVAP